MRGLKLFVAVVVLGWVGAGCGGQSGVEPGGTQGGADSGAGAGNPVPTEGGGDGGNSGGGASDGGSGDGGSGGGSHGDGGSDGGSGDGGSGDGGSGDGGSHGGGSDGGSTGSLPVNAGADAAVCPGGSVVIGPTSHPGYRYSWSPTQGLSAADVARPTASPASTTTYRVVVTDPATGQTGAASVAVTVYARPTATPGADRTVCTGASTLLGAPAVPGLVYKWSGGSGLSSTSAAQPTVSPGASTTYTLQVTDAHACTDTRSVTVAVAQPPLARITDFNGQPPASNVCPGAALSLTGSTSSAAAPATIAGYAWAFGSGATSSGPNASVSVPDGQSPMPVQLTVIDSNGCIATASTQVALAPRPTAHAGPDKTTGSGGSVTVGQPASGGLAPYSYAWTSNDSGCQGSPCINDATAVSPLVSPAKDTRFSVVATDSRGCASLPDSVNVAITHGLTANAGPDRTLCAGQGTNIGLDAGGGTAPYHYAWTSNLECASPSCIGSTTNATTSVSPKRTTVFTQTVTDGANAMASASVTVNVLTPPGTAGEDQFTDAGAPVTLGPTAVNGATYAWTCSRPDCHLSSASAAQPVARPTESTRYRLSDSTSGDCLTVSEVTVWVNIGYSTVPSEGAPAFPVNSVIQVQFDQPIRPETLSRDTVTLHNVDTGFTVPVTLDYDAGSRLLTLTPPAPNHSGYTPSTRFSVTLAGGMSGILSTDATLPSLFSSTRTLHFTTGTLDGAPPVVAESAPARAAVRIPANAPVVASFDEPVDARTVHAGTFQLLADGAPVPGTVRYDFDHRTASFQPERPLAPGTDYTVSLSGVEDLAGNAARVGWTFTAGPPPIP